MPIGTLSLTPDGTLTAATLTLTQTLIPLTTGGAAVVAGVIAGLAPKEDPIYVAIGDAATAEVVKLKGVDTTNDKLEVTRGVVDNHTHAASEKVFVLSTPRLYRQIAKTIAQINA